MKTYIIQYRKDGSWQNYRDDSSFAIEFIFRNHAEAVARDLAAFHELLPSKAEDWQLCDSEGNHYPISVAPIRV